MKPNLAFGPIDSLVQYLLYLSIVVIGIVLPLAIQRWLKKRNARELLNSTLSSLVQELDSNARRMEESRRSLDELTKSLATEASSYRDLWEKLSAAPNVEHDVQVPASPSVPIVYAAPVRTAWDTAHLLQALPLIPADRLAAFARAYQLLAVLHEGRLLFLNRSLDASALDAPCDLRDRQAIARRLEVLLVLKATAEYLARLTASVLEAMRAATKDVA